MQHGALHHTLKPGGGLGVLAVVDGQRGKVFIDIFGQSGPQGIEIDVAGAHHLGGVGIIDQRQQEVLQGGIFVVALAREPDGAVQSLL